MGLRKMGKLIVIEGLDGSGKSTQLSRLQAYFEQKQARVQTVSFPAYELPSCQPVKMYLNGEFGTHPSDVNAYAASLLYAVDRFASYKKQWAAFYQNGGTVLAGRYVTSNIIHQCSKLPKEQWPAFMNWLLDLEYQKVGIPKPNAVVFLEVPIQVSQGLLNKRYAQNGGVKDIHESDLAYLARCHEAAAFAAKHCGWQVIQCCRGNEMRPVEDIFNDILHCIEQNGILEG